MGIIYYNNHDLSFWWHGMFIGIETQHLEFIPVAFTLFS